MHLQKLGLMSAELTPVSALPAPAPNATPDASETIARWGTFYLSLPRDNHKPDAAFIERLAKQVEQDARVAELDFKKPDEKSVRSFVFYPSADEFPNPEEQLVEGTHMHGVEWYPALRFSVHVPRKNQETYRDGDEVASEDYYVIWNGKSILITWRQDAGEGIPLAGGQIVSDVLTTAAKTLGGNLYIQGCHPGCPHLLFHTDLRVVSDPSATDFSHVQVATWELRVTTPVTGSLARVTSALWSEHIETVDDFADAKTLARRALDLEIAVRRDLTTLSELHHQRAAASNADLLGRLAAFWEYRHWRRQSRGLLTRLWLALSLLDGTRRRWGAAHRDYMRHAEEENLQLLFSRDEADDFRTVGDIDLTVVDSAIRHASERLDASALAYATAGGAVAGAIVAAIITLV